METVIILVLIIVILSPFVLRALASMDIFFTFIETNLFKYIERGEGLLDTILAEIPGKILVKNKKHGWKKSKIRDTNPGEHQSDHFSWMNRFFYNKLGIYFYGLYPIYKIKKIVVIKEKDNIEGVGPSQWIIRLGKHVENGLLGVFPRPFVFTAIELKDGFTVHLKLVVKFKVVIPYTPVYEFRSEFFNQAASILQSEVIDVLKEVTTIQDFIDMPKGESEGKLGEFKRRDEQDISDSDFDLLKYSKVNQELIRQVGLCVTGIAISDWVPGNEETEELIKSVATEKIQGDAKIAKAEKEKKAETIDAEKYAKVLEIRTKADVDRENKLIDLRAKRIRESTVNLASSLADPNIVADMVGKILQAEEVAKSNITTWVQEGGNAKPIVPTSGGGTK